MTGKIQSGQLTLNDFLARLQQIRKLSYMKKLLGMMPGAGKIREQLDQLDEREVNRIEAIVRSMTPAERQDLELLNDSHRARIAAGSGTTVAGVNDLVQCFEVAQKMTRDTAGAVGVDGKDGMRMMPGFEWMSRVGKHSKAKQQAENGRRSEVQRKAKSDNPAKAARQAREVLQQRGTGDTALPPALETGAPGVGSLSGLDGGLGGGAGATMGADTPGKSTDGQPALTVNDLPGDIRRMLGSMQTHLGVCWGVFRRHWGVSGS